MWLSKNISHRTNSANLKIQRAPFAFAFSALNSYLVEVNPDPVGNRLSTVLGGGERDRTDDLLRAKQALSQLSYTPQTYCGFAISDCGFSFSLIPKSEFHNPNSAWWA
jgi:hypothetical protein